MVDGTKVEIAKGVVRIGFCHGGMTSFQEMDPSLLGKLQRQLDEAEVALHRQRVVERLESA